jgi:hypothetical protein
VVVSDFIAAKLGRDLVEGPIDTISTKCQLALNGK